MRCLYCNYVLIEANIHRQTTKYKKHLMCDCRYPTCIYTDGVYDLNKYIDKTLYKIYGCQENSSAFSNTTRFRAYYNLLEPGVVIPFVSLPMDDNFNKEADGLFDRFFKLKLLL